MNLPLESAEAWTLTPTGRLGGIATGGSGLGRPLYTQKHGKYVYVGTGGPILFSGQSILQTTVVQGQESPEGIATMAAENVILESDLASSDSGYSTDSSNLALAPAPPPPQRALTEVELWTTQSQHVPHPDSGWTDVGNLVRIGLFRVANSAADVVPSNIVVVELHQVEDGYNLLSRNLLGISEPLAIEGFGLVHDIKSPTEVLIATSQGIIPGVLSPTPESVKPTGYQQTYERYNVRFEVKYDLGPFDCGSAIINATTGEMLGHVLAAPGMSRLVYMHPITQLLQQVSRLTHQDVSFRPKNLEAD